MHTLQRTPIYRIALVLIYLLVAGYIYAMWLIDTRPVINLNGYERARFVDMVYGRAYKPFVRRALVPLIVRAVRAPIPNHVNYPLHGTIYARFPKLYGDMLYLGWELEYLTEYATAAVVMYAALAGFAFALRRLGRALYEMDDWLVDLLPIAALLILPIFFRSGTHMLYDFPCLFLVTLGLVYLVEQRWVTFYILYPLALLNKETAILLTLIFAIYYVNRMRPQLYWPHLVVQGAIFIAIRLGLDWAFRNNPGRNFEPYFLQNLYNALLRPYALSDVLSVAALGLLVGYRFNERPRFLRVSLVIVPPLLLLYGVYGIYGEVRVFYELFPAVFMLSIPTLAAVMGWNMRAAEPAVASWPLPWRASSAASRLRTALHPTDRKIARR